MMNRLRMPAAWKSLFQPIAARTVGALMACLTPDQAVSADARFEARRERMVAAIAQDAQATAPHTGRAVFSARAAF